MYAYIYFLNFVIEIYAFMNPSFPLISENDSTLE